MKKITILILTIFTLPSSAQLTHLASFDPASTGILCGIGYDNVTSKVWIYGCTESSFYGIDTTGLQTDAAPVPGGSANDVDIEIAPQQIIFFHQVVIPQGTVLFVNGETGPAEIYAMDPVSYTVIDTLHTEFGNDHIVGGSYHPTRNSFFIIQDNVPSSTIDNMIAEIDQQTGDTLQTFQVYPYFEVSYGDVEVGDNGNLFIVSSLIDSIAEFTPTGTYVATHDLPAPVTSLSGIALDCVNSQAWVSSTNGIVYRLGNFPCGTTSVEELSLSNTEIIPNPFYYSTQASVAIKRMQNVIIDLFDITGKHIRNIYTGMLPSGKSTFEITADHAGIFLLQYRSENSVFSRKIISLK
jgi:hypothetical protein